MNRKQVQTAMRRLFAENDLTVVEATTIAKPGDPAAIEGRTLQYVLDGRRVSDGPRRYEFKKRLARASASMGVHARLQRVRRNSGRVIAEVTAVA